MVRQHQGHGLKIPPQEEQGCLYPCEPITTRPDHPPPAREPDASDTRSACTPKVWLDYTVFLLTRTLFLHLSYYFHFFTKHKHFPGARSGVTQTPKTRESGQKSCARERQFFSLSYSSSFFSRRLFVAEAAAGPVAPILYDYGTGGLLVPRWPLSSFCSLLALRCIAMFTLGRNTFKMWPLHGVITRLVRIREDRRIHIQYISLVGAVQIYPLLLCATASILAYELRSPCCDSRWPRHGRNTPYM